MIENVIKTGFPTVVNHHNHKRSLGTQSYMCTQTMRLIGPVVCETSCRQTETHEHAHICLKIIHKNSRVAIFTLLYGHGDSPTFITKAYSTVA